MPFAPAAIGCGRQQKQWNFKKQTVKHEVASSCMLCCYVHFLLYKDPVHLFVQSAPTAKPDVKTVCKFRHPVVELGRASKETPNCLAASVVHWQHPDFWYLNQRERNSILKWRRITKSGESQAGVCRWIIALLLLAAKLCSLADCCHLEKSS